MILNRNFVLALFSVSLSYPAFAQPAAAPPTKDIAAYNHVFDRLKTIFPSTPSEEVHLLSTLVPATWGDPNLDPEDIDASFELQAMAGAIPDAEFALDPSRMKIRLDALYVDYVTQSNLPLKAGYDPKKLQTATEAFSVASEEQRLVINKFNGLWKAKKAELKADGKPVTKAEYNRFRFQNGGMFTAVNNKLSASMRDINTFSDVNEKWLRAAALLDKELEGVTADGSGVYSYRGGTATLKAIQADCEDNSTKGWDVIAFNSNTNSQNFRSSRWNGGGSWSGAFFGAKLGGGSSNYSDLVKTASDSVSLEFCNLTYIQFHPGAWYDVTFLQAIDQGVIKLKPGALNYGKPVFGATGVIPRLVKGAIVARRVKFMATSDQSSLSEVRSTSGGGGGFRIGGWGFGGSASKVKFDREYTGENGRYGRSSNMSVPIIIAIVTETTHGSGDLPPSPVATTKPPAPGNSSSSN